MSVAAAREPLTGARWSSAARCPRQGAYTALGMEPDPLDEATQRYFRRGRMFEDLIGEQLVARYGPENVVRQKRIPWKHGTGHADAFVAPERLIVEVVSTVAPSSQVIEDKMRQLKGYVLFDDEAEVGQLYVVNPSSLVREDAFPVTVTDEDREEIEAIVESITRAVETGGRELPERVCRHPGDGRGHLCPFVEPCFADWEAPLAEELPESAKDDVVRLWGRERVVRALAEDAKLAKQQRDEVRARLAAITEPDHEYQLAGVVFRRSAVKGRETFSLATARKAGAWSPLDDERLGPFCRIGEPSERWTVKTTGDVEPEPEEVDYGDVPF